MNPIIGIPRNVLDRPREANPLLPALDQGSPARWWRFNGRGIDRAHENTGFNGQVPSFLNRLPIALGGDIGFHPFKIYHLPPQIRVGPNDEPPKDYDFSTDWRTVRIRGGNIIYRDEVLDFAPGGPPGTVPFQLPQVTDQWCGGAGGPFQPPYTTRGSMFNFEDPRWFGGPLAPTGDYVCEEGKVTFFWITLASEVEGVASFSLHMSTNPATYQDPDSGLFIWDQFPQQNPYNKLIGWVDAATYPYYNQFFEDDPDYDPTNPSNGYGYFAVINQVQTDDMRWTYPPPLLDFGEWSATPPYDQGYPYNAQVTKPSVHHAGQTLVWLSNVWFNTSDPDTGDGTWECRGSFPTTNP